MRKFLTLLCSTVLAAGAISACSEPNARDARADLSQAGEAREAKAQISADVPVARETAPAQHEANDLALWVHPEDPGRSRIFGTGGIAGIEVYDLEGQRLETVAATGEVKGIALLPAGSLGGGASPVLLALDVQTPSVLAYRVDPASGRLAPMEVSGMGNLKGAYEGACSYQSDLDGESYLYLLEESGQIQQWWLQANASGGIAARPVRNLGLASEPAFCVSDPATFSLYVAEKEVGIWRFNADVETEVIPELIDVVKFGSIDGEVTGLAVYRDEQGQAILVASNASARLLNFYDINNDHALIASAGLPGQGGVSDLEEAGGLDVTASNFGSQMPSGLLALADDDASYKLVPWDDVEARLALSRLTTKDLSQPPQAKFARVKPTWASAPVDNPGDAADDPAIWVHPTDPGRSTIIGTNKQGGGLYVYDLDGAVLHYANDGQMNNVDLRYNFALGGDNVDLVTASNRTNHSIAIYKIDPDSRKLIDVADGLQPTDLPDSYGQCMYQNPETRATYVFINDKSGLYHQWELMDSGNGKVRAELVRKFSVPSQPEGCTADDENGVLFVGEEDVGVWKFSAAPDGSDQGELIITVADNPALKDDIEGMSIYYGANGAGYLVVSSQGNDSYAIFDRQGNHDYLGSFVITANSELNLDGASETDGLDVTSANLGPKFPNGLVVVQDGRNLMPAANQDYKAVPWESIAKALNLDIHNGWDPRK